MTIQNPKSKIQNRPCRPLALSAMCAALLVIAACIETWVAAQSPQPNRKLLDPSAWGGDHVGQPLPEFVSGDECLFCHRQDIGTTWQGNHHATTVRDAASEPGAIEALAQATEGAPRVGDVELVMGREERVRFLKRLPAYGKLSLLSVACVPAQGRRPARLVDTDHAAWQNETFATSCAGCHATGVDAETGSFMTLAHDCYVCHGDASLAHTTDSSIMHLSKARRAAPRVVTSICAQCHLRGGASRITGRPYANHFVAGDNLFRDFEVDFSDEHLAELNPADRHVFENVRDVAIFGRERVTCLTCHDVHKQSTRKHRVAAPIAICATCHDPSRPKSEHVRYEVHSPTCQY